MAKVAFDERMGLKQLKTIYRLTKSKPMAFVEAFIQRQIGRGVHGYAAFLMILDLLEKYEEKKGSFDKVLMYANMLYAYHEREATIKLENNAEKIIKKIVEKRGFIYVRLDMSARGNFVEFQVSLDRFYGNPKYLAMEIEDALKKQISELSRIRLKIWIKSLQRR